MKNLSSYNVITFFNYLKIRELMKEDYKRHCGFYDISADAEEVVRRHLKIVSAVQNRLCIKNGLLKNQ